MRIMTLNYSYLCGGENIWDWGVTKLSVFLVIFRSLAGIWSFFVLLFQFFIMSNISLYYLKSKISQNLKVGVYVSVLVSIFPTKIKAKEETSPWTERYLTCADCMLERLAFLDNDTDTKEKLDLLIYQVKARC